MGGKVDDNQAPNNTTMTYTPPVNQNEPMTYQPPQPEPVQMPNNQMINNMEPVNTTPTPQVNIQNTPLPVEPMNQSIPTVQEPMYQPVAEQAPAVNNIPTGPVNYQQPEQPMNVIPNNQVMNNQQPPVNNGVNMINVVPTEPMVNPVPTPMMNPNPGPIPVEPVSSANPQPMPNPNGTTQPSPITPPQPVNPQPINFVYGPNQNNNNPYM